MPAGLTSTNFQPSSKAALRGVSAAAAAGSRPANSTAVSTTKRPKLDTATLLPR